LNTNIRIKKKKKIEHGLGGKQGLARIGLSRTRLTQPSDSLKGEPLPAQCAPGPPLGVRGLMIREVSCPRLEG